MKKRHRGRQVRKANRTYNNLIKMAGITPFCWLLKGTHKVIFLDINEFINNE